MIDYFVKRNIEWCARNAREDEGYFDKNKEVFIKISDLLSKYLYNFGKEYNKKIELSESTEILKGFFDKIGLYKEYIDLINSDSVKYNNKEKDFQEFMRRRKENKTPGLYNQFVCNTTSSVNPISGEVRICYYEDASDMFIMTHEFIHRIFLPNKLYYNNIENDIFEETSSITGEGMLYKYLIDNNIYSDEAVRYYAKRRGELKLDAIISLYKLVMINLVLEGKDIEEYEKCLDDKELLNKDFVLEKIRRDRDLYGRLRYAIGLFVGDSLNNISGLANDMYKNESFEDVINKYNINYYDDFDRMKENFENNEIKLANDIKCKLC